AGIDDDRADERRGAIAGAFERLRKGRRLAGAERAVVVNAGAGGVAAGEDRRMRGQRQRNVSVRVGEADAFLRQSIDDRRQTRHASVGSDAIGAQRVDRHKQDAGVAQRARSNRRPVTRPARAGKRRNRQQGRGEFQHRIAFDSLPWIIPRNRAASRGAWPPASLLKYAYTSTPARNRPISHAAQSSSVSS